MKSRITIIFMLFVAYNASFASENFVKFFMNDGSPYQVFNIEDIEKMEIKKIINNYTMLIYYKPALSKIYQASSIDTLKFTTNNNNQKLLNIYFKDSTKSYLITDIDSILFVPFTIYGSVRIGTQYWLSKNLDEAYYRNGDLIPHVTDPTEWANLTTGAWCYYNNDVAKGIVYGKLYNWYAVNDPRGLAPIGWHIPSFDEYQTQSSYLGGIYVSGGKLKEAETSHWNSPNTGATNSTGYTALPSGYRAPNGVFADLGNYHGTWVTDVYNFQNAYQMYAVYNSASSLFYYNNMLFGFSVRCIKDAPIYEEVTIGTQTWMKKNLDIDHYKNGDSVRFVGNDADWIDAGNKKEGAWCYYNYDPANGAVYGKLYNWYAVYDIRGLAPTGWHVPTDTEWTTLSTYLGGESVAGGKMKEIGTSHWSGPNEGATNSSGFTAVPGGYCGYSGGFAYMNQYGFYWSNTEVDVTYAKYRSMIFTLANISNWPEKKIIGFSVRCIKN